MHAKVPDNLIVRHLPVQMQVAPDAETRRRLQEREHMQLLLAWTAFQKVSVPLIQFAWQACEQNP